MIVLLLPPTRAQIRDLLRPDANPPDGLDLKDHPELGPTLYRDREIWPPLPIDSVEHMFAMLDEVCLHSHVIVCCFWFQFELRKSIGGLGVVLFRWPGH